MTYRTAITALIGALAIPCSAMANTQYGNMLMQRWTGADHCAATAQKQFPDYTPEANAKRDNAMKQCLAISNLPPRDDLNH